MHLYLFILILFIPGKKGKKKGGGPNGNMTDFSGSLLSTDPDDLPDFTKMTEAEKKAYFEAKVE